MVAKRKIRNSDFNISQYFDHRRQIFLHFFQFSKKKIKKNKGKYFMRIVCQQTIIMKHHALLLFFEKAAKFEIVVCCK